MKKFISFISILVVISVGLGHSSEKKISPEFKKWLSNKPPDVQVKVWVFFTDKGASTKLGYEELLKKAEQSLTERAKIRRLKVRKEGNLCDFTDIPVCQKYINEIKKLNCKVKNISKWLNAVSIRSTVKDIFEIAKNRWVKRITPVKTLHCNKIKGIDTINYGHTRRQLEQINVIDAHSLGYTGKGVLIGILDTGFEWRKNKALPGINVIAEYDFIGNDDYTGHDINQWDTVFINNVMLVFREEEKQIHHGTNMLCLLGANIPGVDGFVGSAFNASFALAKTALLKNPTTGSYEDIITEEDWWIAAVEWMDSIGVDIISNSLGYKKWYDPSDSTPNFAYDSLDGKHYRMSKIASMLWTKGILLVSAIGNRYNKDAAPDTCIKAPADADSILTVGGVDTTGKWVYWDQIFSIGVGGVKGPRVDGTLKPEVCGPWIGRYTHPYPYPDYDSLHRLIEGHGTSVSTALVAGACALVWEAHPTWGPMEVRKAIMETASCASLPNDSLGYGIVNVKKAILYGIEEESELQVTSYGSQVYPNPFVRSTEVRIWELEVGETIVRGGGRLGITKKIEIKIYDLGGRLVSVSQASSLTNNRQNPCFTIGENLPVGIYFVKIRVGDKELRSKKMIKISY